MIKTKGFSVFLPYFFLSFIIMIRFLLQDFLFFYDYTPFYELLFIYSWAFIAHLEWNILLLAIIGLARDFLFLDILGLSMLIFVLFAALINSQREEIENRGFLLNWVYFFVSMFIIEVFRCGLSFLVLDITVYVTLIASLKELYFTVISYPLFYFSIVLICKRDLVRV